MKKLFLAAATIIALLCTETPLHAQPKREFRSTWMAGMGIDWPWSDDMRTEDTMKRRLQKYLDELDAQNFTSVCIHIRPRADAYYKSTLEPWSEDFTGVRGKDPGWDPLAFAIEECHKRGMECYAWFNPFRVNANSVDYQTDFDKEWREKGWLMKGVNGTWTIFNPGVEGARRHCLDVFKEVYMNYDIDGMLFDDYFYPGEGMPGAPNDDNNSGIDSDSDDYTTWKQSKSPLSLYDWRRENVNSFVRELFDEIQEVRPDMRFGIGPAGVGHASASERNLPLPKITSNDWQYAKIYADCLAWLEDGSIDFISPQIYWTSYHEKAPHEPLCEWWNMAADHYNRHCYTSVAAYKLGGEFGPNNETGWSEITDQIEFSRKYTKNNSAGQIYYNTKSVNGPAISGLGDYIQSNSYTRKSLVPIVDWKTRVQYPAVSGLEYSNGTLTWKAVEKEARAIVRYSIYAIPSTLDYSQALAEDGDGLNADYLLGVSYSPSFAIPADKTIAHWYAVCVYDGYGYEYEPAFANYSVERAPATTLVSPVNGKQVDWEATFEWTQVNGANYILEFSDTENFKVITKTIANLNECSVSAPLDFITGNTAYWRVVSSLPGMLSSYSTPASFTIPERKPAPTGKPLSPADNFEITVPEIVLTWTVPEPEWEGTDYSLSLEIFKHIDDPTISATRRLMYSTVVDHATGSLTLPVASIGKGDFEWRLKAGGSRWTTNYSPAATFTVAQDIIGIYEKDYQVKTDIDTYPDNGETRLTNLWYRSAHAPYENMVFERKGDMNRGMTAVGNRVYISGRERNTTKTNIYLNEYDASTGELLRTIQLSENGRVPYYPCNDVIKDSEGNICITNLSTDTSAYPLIIFKVNLETGELTQFAELKTNAGQTWRVDHVGITGNINTGAFTLYVPVSSTNEIHVWDNPKNLLSLGTGGGMTYRLKGFYPSDATNFGISPRVVPLDATYYYINGGSIGFSMYRSETLIGSFDSAAYAAPRDNATNGAAAVSLAGRDYIIYSYASAANGVQVAIAEKTMERSFNGLNFIGAFPAAGLGTVESGSGITAIDVVKRSDDEADIFVYSPGNGLAAYRFHAGEFGAVESISNRSENMEMHLVGRTVKFSQRASVVSVSTVAGVQILSAKYVDNIELPSAGTYLVNADGKAALFHVK